MKINEPQSHDLPMVPCWVHRFSCCWMFDRNTPEHHRVVMITALWCKRHRTYHIVYKHDYNCPSCVEAEQEIGHDYD